MSYLCRIVEDFFLDADNPHGHSASVKYNLQHSRKVVRDIIMSFAIDESISTVSVLDCGCGTAMTFFDICDELRSRGVCLLYRGIDIIEKLIHYDRLHSELRNLDWAFDCRSIYDLSNERSEYDVVTCFEVLEHLEKPDLAIRNMVGRVRENGMLVISTPNPAAIQRIAKRFLRKEGEITADLNWYGRAKRDFQAPGAGHGHISENLPCVWSKKLRENGIRRVKFVRGTLLYGTGYLDHHPFLFGIYIILDRIMNILPLSSRFSWNVFMWGRKTGMHG